MNAIFKKLNYKDQQEIIVLNAPESFVPVMKEMEVLAAVKQALPKDRKIYFALAFVTLKKEIDGLADKLTEALEGDGILWMVYPKGTSKKYKCDFNRDNGWDALKSRGWETVRMVAIDEDWSALRFRRAAYVRAAR